MKKALTDPAKWQEIVTHVLDLARQEGATSAEVSASVSDGFSVNVRLGDVETVEYHRDKGMDITVYFGERQGASSTSDTSPSAIKNAVSAACSIAKATGKDPYNGLADPEILARTYPDCDLYHPWDIDVSEGIEIARSCESYGMSADKRIKNSEGAGFSTNQSFHIYANSHDFMGHYFTSLHAFNCTLIAEDKGHKERDYEHTLARAPQDLDLAKTVGERAAHKTIARLNAQKLSTRETPVIFAAPVACGLIGHFVAAIRGSNLYRESSFLLNTLGKSIFPSFITMTETPHLLKGLGSAPFDAEGVVTQSRTLVEAGVLQNYVLSSYSARKLGMRSTGNAGGVHNLTVQATAGDLSALLKRMDTGLLITEVMGQGVNILTGDYSRGAVGFWVEKGEIQYPVHEITIAGNLKNMLLGLQAAGNDIERRGNIRTGSLLLDHMVIAGE